MADFRVVHESENEVRVLHSATNFIFHFAVEDGALAPTPGQVRPIPEEAQAHLSDAQRAAIAFLKARRTRAVLPAPRDAPNRPLGKQDNPSAKGLITDEDEPEKPRYLPLHAPHSRPAKKRMPSRRRKDRRMPTRRRKG
jgi:hypothetical protein